MHGWLPCAKMHNLSCSVTEHTIKRTGAPDLVVYVINARTGSAGPGVLHFHGGGLNAGSAAGSFPGLQELALELDCPIVTVEYRIAPEARYNESTDDDYAALDWLHSNAERVGIDPGRIVVLGESAGGTHAALLATNARDRGELPIAFQVLIYPMLDDRTGSSRAVPDHVGAFGWNAEANRFGWSCFLGQDAGLPEAPAGSVPARVEDLHGLPPTYISVGAVDLFVDECIDYARRLIDAGVQTELFVAPGGFHGFDSIVRDAEVSKRFAAAKVDAVRRALAQTEGL